MLHIKFALFCEILSIPKYGFPIIEMGDSVTIAAITPMKQIIGRYMYATHCRTTTIHNKIIIGFNLIGETDD